MGKEKKSKKKWPLGLRILRAFLITLAVIIVLWTAFSLIGRINAANVIPDSFSFYFQTPNPVALLRELLRHESLPEILALPDLGDLSSVINQIRDSGLLENKWIELAARGKLEGAILDGRILGAWDMGLLSPLLRILPMLAGRIAVPNLYYVQGGKYSCFEYRMDDGKVFYIGPYHNLLIISDDRALFESVLDGTSRNDDRRGSTGLKEFQSKDFHLACLFAPDFLAELIGGDDSAVTGALGFMQFNGNAEASLSIKPRQLELHLYAGLSSNQADLQKIIGSNSGAPDLFRMIPDNTQYMTLLAAGSLEELLNAASAIPGSEIEDPWRKADSASRTLLRIGIDELLLSWSGREFAVFGMEGRPAPVIVMEVIDERKRDEVFNRIFSSLFINENAQLNLDGTRIPRIELPAFLSSLLLGMGIKIPSAYYTVHDGYLFISESAESLLDAVNGARRNRGLLRTDIWQTLSGNNSDAASFTLFYSLDRSLPFFVKGNNLLSPILRLYQQGLLRLTLKNSQAHAVLSIIPGQGKGLSMAPGFPLEPGGRIANQINFMGPDRSGDSRILLSSGNTAIAIDPANLQRKTLEVPGSGRIWIIPAHGIDGAVWIVSSQGRIYLCDKDLEPMRGFPRITALRLTAPPVAHNAKLYLAEYNGYESSVHVIDERAAMEQWQHGFTAALLSPISIINFNNRVYTACYPKEFLGSIWLMDERGINEAGWPVWVSGIAFGSPLVFESENRLAVAFVTQAGDLSVYDEAGRLWNNFPVVLDGIFYIQPVFDGEFIWLVSSDGTLYQVSSTGYVLSHKIPNLEVKEEGHIAVYDVDNDGKPEIFISGEGNALHGYTRNFNSLDGFPLPVWGKPDFANLRNTGKTAITGAGMDNRLYLWQFK